MKPGGGFTTNVRLVIGVFFLRIRCEVWDSEAVILTVQNGACILLSLPIHGNLCLDVLFYCHVDG